MLKTTISKVLLISENTELHAICEYACSTATNENNKYLLVSVYDSDTAVQSVKEIDPDFIVISDIPSNLGNVSVLEQVQRIPGVNKIPICIIFDNKKSMEENRASSLYIGPTLSTTSDGYRMKLSDILDRALQHTIEKEFRKSAIAAKQALRKIRRILSSVQKGLDQPKLRNTHDYY